jgi:hypothetical protein
VHGKGTICRAGLRAAHGKEAHTAKARRRTAMAYRMAKLDGARQQRARTAKFLPGNFGEAHGKQAFAVSDVAERPLPCNAKPLPSEICHLSCKLAARQSQIVP